MLHGKFGDQVKGMLGDNPQNAGLVYIIHEPEPEPKKFYQGGQTTDGGTKVPNLSESTVAEVIEFQKAYRAEQESQGMEKVSARLGIGHFSLEQLEEAVQHGIIHEDTLFDKDAQANLIFAQVLNSDSALLSLGRGEITVEDFEANFNKRLQGNGFIAAANKPPAASPEGTAEATEEAAKPQQPAPT